MSQRFDVIALTGCNGVGKSTLSKYIEKLHGYKHVSFSDLPKISMMKLYSLSRDQLFGKSKDVIDTRYNKTPRQMLIEYAGMIQNNLGGDLCDDPNEIFCELLFKGLEPGKYVIDDLYFKHQYNYLKRNTNLLVVKLVNDRQINNYTRVEDIPCDYAIYNNYDKIMLYMSFEDLVYNYVAKTTINSLKDNNKRTHQRLLA